MLLIIGKLRGNLLNRTVHLCPTCLYGPKKIIKIVFLSVSLGAKITVIKAGLIHLHAIAAKNSKVDCYTYVAKRYASLNHISSTS